MKGKAVLLASVAALALVSTAGLADAASKKKAQTQTDTSSSPSMDKKWADQSTTTNSDLEERVRKLEEEVEKGKDKQSSDHNRLSSLEQNFNDTSWSFDNARPTVKSGDGRFTMAIRVRFQADMNNFLQQSGIQNNDHTLPGLKDVQFKDLSSGAVVRRAFFGVEGKAFNDFWYEFRYNAGGSDGSGPTEGDPVLSLARVAYLGIPNFRINLGVIEPAFMFEGTTSSGQLEFMERPEIDNIAADSFGAADSRRGAELLFQKADALMPGDNLVLSTAFTGSKTGSNSGHGNNGDEQSQWLAHGTYRLWSDGISNLSIGGDYSHAFSGGNIKTFTLQDRPEFRVDGTRLISTTDTKASLSGSTFTLTNDGAIAGKTANMYAFNAGVNIENFFLGGEYAHFSIDRDASGAHVADTPQFSGWYVEGSWVLTGEPRQYTVSATNNEVGGFGAPKVASPFSLDGDSWGAWELTARYSDTDLNWHDTHIATATTQQGIAGGEEKVFLVGLNWYLNQNIKLQVNDAWVKVDKHGAPSTATSIETKLGQDLNIVGVRLQFTN